MMRKEGEGIRRVYRVSMIKILYVHENATLVVQLIYAMRIMCPQGESDCGCVFYNFIFSFTFMTMMLKLMGDSVTEKTKTEEQTKRFLQKLVSKEDSLGKVVFLVKSFILICMKTVISSYSTSKAKSTGIYSICYNIMFVLSGSK